MTKINVAFAFDENLWRQTAVAIFSMCQAAPHVRYEIYALVDQNVHGVMRDLVRLVVKKSGNRRARIHFIGFNGNLLSHEFYDTGMARFPRAAMARIFLPQILKNVGKIIWMDSDVIVCKSLTPMWRIKMHGKLIGAVRDINIGPIVKKYPTEFAHYDEYNLNHMVAHHEYVNSGVLLMNLREMRIFGWTEKCMKRIQSEQRNIWYFDQDVINSVSCGKIAYMPLRFNRMSKLPIELYIKEYGRTGLSRENLIDDYYNYCVLHYAGNDKPWDNRGPYCDVWHQFAKMAGVV
ncbi:MAG: glycosyltransferase family 8 protein [Muribaculaceae bacterium]|nr:glycosyltransferase family 8 protein [Muribaculaceae bacterium]